MYEGIGLCVGGNPRQKTDNHKQVRGSGVRGRIIVFDSFLYAAIVLSNDSECEPLITRLS